MSRMHGESVVDRVTRGMTSPVSLSGHLPSRIRETTLLTLLCVRQHDSTRSRGHGNPGPGRS